MDTVWKVLIQYFICVCSLILVTKGENISCDFETTQCGWTSTGANTNTDWIRNLANTWTVPHVNDHTNKGEGFYVRFQTYDERKQGDFKSPSITLNAPTCLSFWFYVNGTNINSFVIDIKPGNEFPIDIAQQYKWYQHLINLSSGVNQVTIKAEFNGIVAGKGRGRCIIVDDVMQIDGLCTNSSSSVITAGTTISLSISPTTLKTTTGLSISPTTLKTTTGLSISPTPLKTTTGEPNSVAQSSNTSSTTGIIVGVVLGIGFIVGLVALLFCFLRRSKSVRKKSASADNKILTNDYTGQQSVSLPTLSNPISNNDGYADIQTQNVNYQHVNSRRKTSINTSGRNYAKLDPTNKLSDNKAGNGVINHDYVYIDETEAGSKQTSINVPEVNILNGEIDMNNQYSVIDPNANNDHSSELDKNVTCATPPLSTCNYLILDPNETGFFRSQGHNKTTTDYDVAIPINDKDHVSDLPHPYSMSEQGTYDSTGKVRHMEAEANLYSHSVENVYDTSSHERKTVENDSTYDHFFGDQTEDNYNITKR